MQAVMKKRRGFLEILSTDFQSGLVYAANCSCTGRMSRLRIHALPTTLRECIYGRPNAYSELPAAIAMYSLPSTSNAIGDAYTAPPI